MNAPINTFEQFKQEVMNYAYNERPKYWRIGQAVFNYVDAAYGVARKVQFEQHVDCFYNDEQINSFLQKSYEIINEQSA